ncbi:hypothetical protein A8C56_21020 [Niabella ginsenosidivorans]|uniref:TonB C-terminal domain-containing protein n=1 Tax=Niabella ginsenosidivorans TaxID=1176587 RepID=A0A1A9I8X2_9BACT|nr:WG repeat-containing protein [Niabella ginsenosidivorans]ANH83131.1 hypothetical protein A8C56_21020 [Niabella ginsenosidivorans]
MKSFLFLFFLTAAGLFTSAQDSLYDGGSPFVLGFARVEKGKDYYYIDTLGRYAFDRFLNGSTLLLSDENGSLHEGDSTLLPENTLLVSRKGRLGLLSPEGKWLLQPEYDSIDTRSRTEWVVKKKNTQSLFTPSSFLLPFRFEEVYNMNGRYFNVRLQDQWGVYDREANRLTVPCSYEDMDYCYGCEEKGDYCFAKKNGKWGVIDFNNNVLLPFEYDHEHSNMRSDEWVECFYQNGKQLSINLRTKETDTCNCNETNENEEEKMAGGFMIKNKNGKYGLLNAQGRLILDYQYDYIRYDADTSGTYLPAPFAAITKNGKSGVADTTGKIIIPPIYMNAFSYMKQGDLFYTEVRGKERFFDKKGNLILPGYDSLERTDMPDDYPDAPGLIKIRQNGLLGFYNASTKTLVKPKYTHIHFFDAQQAHSIINVQAGKKEGYIDVNGKVIVPPVYDHVFQDNPDSDLVSVSRGEGQGIYRISQQKLIIPTIYQDVTVLQQRLFWVQGKNGNDNNKCEGLIDFSGKVLYAPVPYQEIEVMDSVNRFILVSRRDTHTSKITYTLFNALTREQTQLPYDTILIGGNADLLGVQIAKGRYALYDAVAGKIVKGAYTQNGYPEVVYPYNNNALVMKDGKWDIIRKDGSTFFHLQYDFVQLFPPGIIMVANKKAQEEKEVRIGDPAVVDSIPRITEARGNGLYNYVYGFADSTGKLVVPLAYDTYEWINIRDYVNNDTTLLLLKKDSNDYGQYLKGCAAADGTIIVPAEYKEVIPTEDKKGYLVIKHNKYGIISARGKTILPAEFDSILYSGQNFWGDAAPITFPVAALKDGVYRYYDAMGRPLPCRLKGTIDFTPPYDVRDLSITESDEWKSLAAADTTTASNIGTVNKTGVGTAVVPPVSAEDVLPEDSAVNEQGAPPAVSKEPAYTAVAVMPQYPGGEKALQQYIKTHLRPQKAVQGNVLVAFIVDKKGKIRAAHALNDIGGSCAAEAVRVVQTMPDWIPGKQNGATVNVRRVIPVIFMPEK